jgi:hypothetical protein
VEVRREPPSENSLGSIPQPAKKKQGRPTLEVKYKKVTSQKKAREQARTIIVSVLKEEEGDGSTRSAQGECSRSR